MVLQILTSYGIAYLLSESNLLIKPREYIASKNNLLAELIYCPICLSFWIALALTQNILQAFAIMGAIAIIKKL